MRSQHHIAQVRHNKKIVNLRKLCTQMSKYCLRIYNLYTEMVHGSCFNTLSIYSKSVYNLIIKLKENTHGKLVRVLNYNLRKIYSSFQKSKKLVDAKSLSMGVGCDELLEAISAMVDDVATSV